MWYKDIFNFGGIKNIDKNLPPKKDLRSYAKLEQNQRLRATQTIEKFRIAQRTWENVTLPQRYLMYDIYRDVILDTQVASCLQSRQVATTGAKFRLVDENGVENKDLTKLFKTKWFHDFVSNAVDTKYWGFTLHQLGPIQNDKFMWVDFIDRYNVKPELQFQIVTENTYQSVGLNYTDPLYRDWVIPDGNHNDKGILEKVALMQLYKRWALGAWSEYMEIYGQPTRIGKTDVRDEEAFGNMINMLSNMGTNAWGVFNTDDSLEFIDSMKSTTGDSIYEHLIKYCDEQIAKIIVGQTMTSENGSSRSQAEVHERVARAIFLDDQIEIEYLINDELIPRMIKLGRGGLYQKLANHTFEFYHEEEISLKERSEIDKNITAMGKQLTDNYIISKYGVELENPSNDISNKLKNLYGA
jgi:hypothetical protein